MHTPSQAKPLRILKLDLYAYRNAWQHLRQRNKGVLLPLHRHRLQQEQNHFGTQFFFFCFTDIDYSKNKIISVRSFMASLAHKYKH
jgi:hypothetical protein